MAKQVYAFNAELDGWPAVRRTIAVRGDQTLLDLHGALQAAFDWDDDHLYSFWLSGKFWASDSSEYTHPFASESDPFAGWDVPIAKPGRKSVARRLDGVRLTKGQRIAYLFDFGDEWRVRLTVRQISADDSGPLSAPIGVRRRRSAAVPGLRRRGRRRLTVVHVRAGGAVRMRTDGHRRPPSLGKCPLVLSAFLSWRLRALGCGDSAEQQRRF